MTSVAAGAGKGPRVLAGLALGLAAGAFAPMPALAQTAPDAGSLLRQQQELKRVPERLPEAEGREETPVAAPAADAVSVRLRDVQFTGDVGLVGEEALRAVVADAIGRELDFAGLQALAARVTEHLREQGFLLARAYLPRQDVTEGVIEIAVLEGRLDGDPETGGGWRIELDEGTRTQPKLLGGIAEAAAASGSAVRQDELERALLLMDDVPAITARSRLEPGAETGTTRVVVDAVEGPLLTGVLWGNNYGNTTTGREQLNALVELNSPAGVGDRLTLSGTVSEGVRLGRAGLDLPLNPHGLRVSLGGTYMRYRVVEGDGVAAGIEGDSVIARGELSYPVVRTRALSFYGALGYDYKQMVDDSDAGVLRDKRIHAGTVRLYGNALDSLGGGGVSNWDLQATLGDLDLSGAPADEAADAATLNTQGVYTRLAAQASRLQNLPGDFSLLVRAAGQLAFDNLDSSEEFILGGPNGVRAYPVGEAQGDEGWLASAEFRYDVPGASRLGALRLTAFVDTGGIRLHHDPANAAIATVTGDNTYQLSGAGLGLRLGNPGSHSIAVSWAHTLGDNPGRALDGTDADGDSREHRFWVQALIRF